MFCIYLKIAYLIIINIILCDICLSYDVLSNSELPKLHKCCKKDEVVSHEGICVPYSHLKNNKANEGNSEFYFNDDTNDYPTVITEGILLSDDYLETKPSNAFNLSEKFSIIYNKKPCDIVHEGEIIFLSNDNNIFIFENGSLLINKTGKTYHSSVYCVDNVVIDVNNLTLGNFVINCPFLVERTFRNCCTRNEIMKYSAQYGNWSCTYEEFASSLSQQFEDFKEISSIHVTPKCRQRFEFYSINDEYSNISIADLNVLNDGRLEYKGETFKKDEYCGAYSLIGNEEFMFNVFACRKKEIASRYIIYATLYFVGAIFLFSTLVIYLIFPELRRKVHAYNLMTHVACLLLGYVTMIFATIGADLLKNTVFCKIIGLIMHFSFLGGFFWVNVMCIDITLAFSQLKPLNSIKGKSENKKYMYYSLYAWGLNSFITIATIISEYTSIVPTKYKPNFGKETCWFKGSSLLIYFHIPMCILLIMNTYLFINTSLKICYAHRDVASSTKISVRAHEGRKSLKRRNRFILYLKLFIIMGASWILEVVDEYFIEFSYYSVIIIDSINLLRAFFIFVIFCCKKEVFYLFFGRIKKDGSGNRMSAQSNTITLKSRSSSIQF